MKVSLIVAGLVAACLLCLSGCSKDDPTVPNGSGPDTLVVEAQVLINGGSAFTGDQAVALSITCDDADSVLVFNVDGTEWVDNQWFELTNGELDIPLWDVVSGEGPKTVGAQFRKTGLVDSDTVSTEIILDMTPPNVPPSIIYPVSGASNVPSVAALSWAPAEDQLCPAEDLHYSVFFGASDPPSELVWSGYETGTILENLGQSTTWYWRIVASDLAGNAHPGVSGSFSTWDLELPDFKLIPAGTFMMGSPASELGHSPDEELHQVTLSRPFFIGSTNITVGQFLVIVNWAADQGLVVVDEEGVYDNLSGTNDLIIDFTDVTIFDYLPGGNIGTHSINERICQTLSWYGAAAFCDWLNILAGFETLFDRNDDWRCNGGDVYGSIGFRLSAEAEWEYSCRAGSTTAFANGEITGVECWDPILDQIGWYCGNYMIYNFLPAQKIPNAWGLYDMQGGGSDWCYDKWADYPAGNAYDPVNDTEGLGRVVRGSRGNFPGYSKDCRSGARGAWQEDTTWGFNSIRLVFSYGPLHE